MGTNKITKSEFARLAGVNPSTVTKVCKTQLAAAWDGKRVDPTHPSAVAYLENRARALTPPPATGIDQLYESAVEACTRTGRWSIASLQRELRISFDRAKPLIETMRANGLVPQGHNHNKPTPAAVPKAQPPAEPKLRGNAAANFNKKELALAEAAARVNEQFVHEVPANIEAFADMTLRELVERFGTDTAFLDWLKATKEIENINEKRLKNSQTKGTLISRALVKDHVIDTFNSAHLRMMKDGSKSIAAGVVSKSTGGAELPEIEAYVSDIMGSFIRPIKNKIARVLKES